jgi:lysophospholipase L1-like esterase
VGQPDEASLDDVLLGDSLLLGCDAYPGIKAAGSSMISGDHIHPNDAGHQKIAEAFEAPIPACPPGG